VLVWDADALRRMLGLDYVIRRRRAVGGGSIV
jgi:hypothetical protein